MHALDQSQRRVWNVRRRGFSMTELLVVIGIIAILAGVLLVALGGVRTRAKHTQTLSTMSEFAGACEAFQIEHGQYPGVIPDTVLAKAGAGGSIQISGTENALLHLMGGYQVQTPFGVVDGADATIDPPWTEDEGQRIICAEYTDDGWTLCVNINRIGEGPVINGKPYAPYYTPTESAVGVAKGQWNQVMTANIKLPDLLDAWGQPIIYVRRARPVGPLVGTYLAGPGPPAPPQYYYELFQPYVMAQKLGELGAQQLDATHGSILNTYNSDNPVTMCAQMLRHPAFGDKNLPLTGTARGGFVLLSAGPDGIYFSKADGPGTPKDGKHIGQDPSFIDFYNFGPAVFDDFDDVRVFGGG